MEYSHRHTKIIFTIGPATEEESMLRSLIEEGVDICRLNMAHATHEWTEMTIKKIKKVCESLNRHIAIMMDIKGPEIRTGNIDGMWTLEIDEIFDLYMDPNRVTEAGNEVRGVSVNYPKLVEDIHVGNVILVDNGLVHLKVIEKQKDALRCKVLIPGELKSKRHINLPGIKVSLPALTDKDRADLEVGIAQGIEFVALSFVRESKDIQELRGFLKEKGSKALIIAKIEDQSAISNLEAIIKESDGLMVARGDLGIECPFEQLPLIQRHAVKTCINNAKPVIVATHMLESMITAPVPTRAEVSDVSNAVFEQADAIMLSGETTIGKYPLRCIDVMKRVSYEVEKSIPTDYNSELVLNSPKNKMLKSAVVLAQGLENTGIIVFTRSGRSAQLISSLRPTRCPLYAISDNFTISKQLRLVWGIEAFHMDFLKDRDETIERALKILKSEGKIKSKDHMIVLTSVVVGDSEVDTIQLRNVP